MTGKRNTPAVALHMQKTLMVEATTTEQLAAVSGLSVSAVRRWIKTMRDAKAIYVENFTDDARGRKFTPMWRWGKKPDAKRPGPQRTETERMRDYRARKAAANAHS